MLVLVGVVIVSGGGGQARGIVPTPLSTIVPSFQGDEDKHEALSLRTVKGEEDKHEALSLRTVNWDEDKHEALSLRTVKGGRGQARGIVPTLRLFVLFRDLAFGEALVDDTTANKIVQKFQLLLWGRCWRRRIWEGSLTSSGGFFLSSYLGFT